MRVIILLPSLLVVLLLTGCFRFDGAELPNLTPITPAADHWLLEKAAWFEGQVGVMTPAAAAEHWGDPDRQSRAMVNGIDVDVFTWISPTDPGQINPHWPLRSSLSLSFDAYPNPNAVLRKWSIDPEPPK